MKKEKINWSVFGISEEEGKKLEKLEEKRVIEIGIIKKENKMKITQKEIERLIENNKELAEIAHREYMKGYFLGRAVGYKLLWKWINEDK